MSTLPTFEALESFIGLDKVLYLARIQEYFSDLWVQGLALSEPVGTPPRQVYERRFRLTFPLRDGDAVQIDPALIQLQGTLSPLVYDALGTTPAPAGSLAADGPHTVIAELHGLRTLVRLDIQAAAVQDGDVLEIYRLDGDVLAGEPTVTASVSGAKATFDGFLAVRFAIRLRRSSALRPLAPASVTGVFVRSVPMGVRAGVGPAGGPGASFFWRADLQPDFDPDATTFVVDEGAALLAPLQQAVDNATPRPNGNLAVDVVLASDGPCLLTAEVVSAGHHLVRRRWGSAVTPKEVLRFPGGQLADRSLELQLPRGAPVQSAVVEALESFGEKRFALGQADILTRDLASAASMHVGGGREVAQRFPETATGRTLRGMALALAPLTSEAELELQLRSGGPGRDGRLRASAVVTIDGPGERRWWTAMLSVAIALEAGESWWLQARMRTGELLWLTAAQDESSAELRQGGETRRWASVAGYQVLLEPILLGQLPVGYAPDRGDLLVEIGDAELEGVRQDDGRVRFDLKAALSTALASADDGAVEVRFVSGLAGVFTVYPPEVVYSKPGS